MSEPRDRLTMRVALAAQAENRRLRDQLAAAYAALEEARLEATRLRVTLAVVVYAHPNPEPAPAAIPAPRDPIDELIRRGFRLPRQPRRRRGDSGR